MKFHYRHVYVEANEEAEKPRKPGELGVFGWIYYFLTHLLSAPRKDNVDLVYIYRMGIGLCSFSLVWVVEPVEDPMFIVYTTPTLSPSI